jgi:hypothetical protein
MDLFEKRLKRIARALRRSQRFSVLGPSDGAGMRRSSMPRGTMLLAFVLALATSKGAAMASLGHSSYEERLAAMMHDGSMVQRMSAVIMMPDPMSAEIARLIGPVLR